MYIAYSLNAANARGSRLRVRAAISGAFRFGLAKRGRLRARGASSRKEGFGAFRDFHIRTARSDRLDEITEMARLRMESTPSPEINLIINDNPGSQSRTEGEDHDISLTFAITDPMFGENRGCGVVLEINGNAEAFGDHARDRNLPPGIARAGEIRRVQKQALVRVRGARPTRCPHGGSSGTSLGISCPGPRADSSGQSCRAPFQR